MKSRITLRRPEYDHQFEIKNGNLTKSFTWWEFNPRYEELCQLQDLGLEKCQFRMNDVLRLVGSHAKLWIGGWEGTIAPMDVQPQGWTYPNGTPLEPEWWWQWHPCDRAESEAVAAFNMSVWDAWESNSPLKAGVPLQVQRQTGGVSAIAAIPVMRLPALMKQDVLWTFEFELSHSPPQELPTA